MVLKECPFKIWSSILKLLLFAPLEATSNDGNTTRAASVFSHEPAAVSAPGVALCSHSQKEYYLISKSKNWHNAQKYCRQKYTDLATVQDAHDVSRLSSLGKQCWIGLQKTNNWFWAWSLQGDSSSLTQFTNWDTSLPIDSNCGAIRADGKWEANPCKEQLPFVCQSGEHAATLVVSSRIAGCRSFKLM